MSSSRATRFFGRSALLLGIFSASLGAQGAPPNTGRIVGRVIDAASGQGLPDVGIQVVGTTLGAQSGVDGRYALVNVPAGPITIQLRRLGFQPKSVTGILLEAGKTQGELAADLDLDAAAVLFIGTIQGLVMQSLLAGDVARIRRDAPGVFAIYRRGIANSR